MSDEEDLVISLDGAPGIINEGQITLYSSTNEDLAIHVAGKSGQVGEGVVTLSDDTANEQPPNETDGDHTEVGEANGKDDLYEDEQRKEGWDRIKHYLSNSYLYFYFRSLFPTPKELDYRWEWNPWIYLKKFVGLEETGKNRSKHKQNYPYPFIVIIYCGFGSPDALSSRFYVTHTQSIPLYIAAVSKVGSLTTRRIGAFLGIAVVAIITQYGFNRLNEPLLIGTRAASASACSSRLPCMLTLPKNNPS